MCAFGPNQRWYQHTSDDDGLDDREADRDDGRCGVEGRDERRGEGSRECCGPESWDASKVAITRPRAAVSWRISSRTWGSWLTWEIMVGVATSAILSAMSASWVSVKWVDDDARTIRIFGGRR